MRILFTIIFLSVIAGAGVILYFYNEVRFEAEKLIHYTPPLTTQIFDKNGKLISNLFEKENRIYAKFDEIPSRVIEALLAIEDTMFFEHYGVNFDAILRAIVKDVKAGKLVEGASTLTQQLIKTTLLTREKKISRKIKELILALSVETALSKEDILERYLNQIYFGHGYYGIKTASNGYFHKELNELTLKEIAILVGLPKAPSFYDPTKNLEFSLSRANRVLFRMHHLGWINDDEFNKSIKEQPLIYDETLTRNSAPYVVNEVIKKLIPNYPNLKSGGYKVFTTIDLNLQYSAREALKFSYDAIKARDKKDKYSKELNGALVALENSTGNILALVGGVDYAKSNFNRATQSNRQPGSSFKPFIYQNALDLGYSPTSPIADISRTYKFKTDEDEEKTWQPKNYEKDFKGLITLREAIVHSRNLATINLVEAIGLNNLYDKLTNHYGFVDIPSNLSISLGSFGISPLKLAEAYTIFSNYGTKREAILIKAIENRYSQRKEFKTSFKKLTEPKQAFLMVSILKDVVTSGTGRNAKVDGVEIAGKTGTSNNNVDAWFCGFSPSVECIVWFGNDDNTPMKRYETGGRAAAPAVGYFFKKLVETYPQIKRKFDIPKGVVTSKVGGKDEYFTEISKPPSTKIEEADELIF